MLWCLLTLVSGSVLAAADAGSTLPPSLKGSPLTQAESSPAERAAATLVPESGQIEALEVVVENGSFDDSDKTALLDRLTKISIFKGQAETDRQQGENYQNRIEQGPSELDATHLAIKRLQRTEELGLELPDSSYSTPVKDLLPDTISSQQTTITQQLTDARLELERLDDRSKKLTADLAELRDRPENIHRELGDINERLARIDIAIQTLEADNETPSVPKLFRALTTDADPNSGESQSSQKDAAAFENLTERWVLAVEALALTNKATRNRLELASHSIRVELTQAQLALASERSEQLSERIDFLQNRLNDLNIEQASRLKSELEEELADSATLIGAAEKVITANQQQNLQLSDDLLDRSQLTKAIEDWAGKASTQLADIRDRFRSTRSKVEVAGLSQALGQALLEERRQLREPRLSEARVLTSRDLIAKAGLAQIQHTEMRRGLRDIEYTISQIVKRNKLTDASMPLPEIKQTLMPVLERRASILDELSTADQRYVRALTELDFAVRQLDQEINNYLSFISERLLWIRSSPVVDIDMIFGVGTQVRELFRLEHWRLLVRDIGTSLQVATLWWVGAALALLAYFRRWRLKALLKRYAEPLGRLRTDRFSYSIKALAVTLLLALPWPIMFLCIERALAATILESRVAVALSATIPGVLFLLLYLQIVRMIFIPNGIASAHLRWPTEMVSKVYADLNRFLYMVMPLLLLTTGLVNFDFGADIGALPNLAPLPLLGVLAFAFVRLFAEDRGFMLIYRHHRHQQKSSRLHRWLVTIAVTISLMLAFSTLLGYLYTAGTVFVLIGDSIFLFISLLVVHLLLVRWIVLTQRKVEYQAAIERRDAARLEARAAAQATDESSEPPRSAEMSIAAEIASEAEQSSTVDFAALSRGMRELLSTIMLAAGVIGIWMIWADVLPALNVLEDVSVWQYTEGSGESASIIPVTLLDLSLSLLILVLTIYSARRLPALLEFAVLQRMDMGPGGSYTVRTLSGYIVVAVGIIVALGQIGASWSQIQWMAAALSVGIGFGLQEIVANFISGLIILFERPIRVGDVVTVGDTDGVVTKIKIRATTIRNWDNKELLVPNKEFITSRLLNWTLSDQTTRLLLPIGIEFGSDPVKAMDIIINIARNHPNVLEDPAPLASFEAFGDSSLRLFLRAYVGILDYRIPVTTDLHTQIYCALREAGIGIAFPHRDVHLDTRRPLEFKLLQESAGSTQQKPS